jgi:LDH2 family malate/lactate/ureidoglycolate dehydrogenase
VDAAQFYIKNEIADRIQLMTEKLHEAPKAKGAQRIFVPGEIEWSKHKTAEESGIQLPADVLESLMGLSRESGITLPVDK